MHLQTSGRAHYNISFIRDNKSFQIWTNTLWLTNSVSHSKSRTNSRQHENRLLLSHSFCISFLLSVFSLSLVPFFVFLFFYSDRLSSVFFFHIYFSHSLTNTHTLSLSSLSLSLSLSLSHTHTLNCFCLLFFNSSLSIVFSFYIFLSFSLFLPFSPLSLLCTHFPSLRLFLFTVFPYPLSLSPSLSLSLSLSLLSPFFYSIRPFFFSL